MAARRTRFGCGHRGFGAQCHRCAQAEALLVKADAILKTKEKDRNEKAKEWRTEAERLKGEQKKRQRTIKKVVVVAEESA
jgi:hypothetical protein